MDQSSLQSFYVNRPVLGEQFTGWRQIYQEKCDCCFIKLISVILHSVFLTHSPHHSNSGDCNTLNAKLEDLIIETKMKWVRIWVLLRLGNNKYCLRLILSTSQVLPRVALHIHILLNVIVGILLNTINLEAKQHIFLFLSNFLVLSNATILRSPANWNNKIVLQTGIKFFSLFTAMGN